MTLLSKTLTTLGVLLLTHATYSAHEHHTLLTAHTRQLPHDIVLETVLSTLLLATALVLGSAAFRPISWRAWAGKIEREGGLGNPFLGLGGEERSGFVDIRARRREFAEWVKGQGGAAEK